MQDAIQEAQRRVREMAERIRARGVPDMGPPLNRQPPRVSARGSKRPRRTEWPWRSSSSRAGDCCGELLRPFVDPLKSARPRAREGGSFRTRHRAGAHAPMDRRPSGERRGHWNGAAPGTERSERRLGRGPPPSLCGRWGTSVH